MQKKNNSIQITKYTTAQYHSWITISFVLIVIQIISATLLYYYLHGPRMHHLRYIKLHSTSSVPLLYYYLLVLNCNANNLSNTPVLLTSWSYIIVMQKCIIFVTSNCTQPPACVLLKLSSDFSCNLTYFQKCGLIWGPSWFSHKVLE